VRAYALISVLYQPKVAALEAPLRVLTSERAVNAIRNVILANRGQSSQKLYAHHLDEETQAGKATTADGGTCPCLLPIRLSMPPVLFARRLQSVPSSVLASVCAEMRWIDCFDAYSGTAKCSIYRSGGVIRSTAWWQGLPLLPALRGMKLEAYYFYFGDSRRDLSDAGDEMITSDPLVLEWLD